MKPEYLMQTQPGRLPKSKPKNNPWFVLFERRPTAKLRLFCFPYAGGSAMIYRTWAASLPDMIEVIAVELPGRGARLREPTFTSLESLVNAIGQQIMPHLHTPFALFGHSMGAVISYELARLLETEFGVKPLCLFVSGREAPQIPDPDPPPRKIGRDELIERLRRLNGTPTEVLEHGGLMELMLPVLQADFELLYGYEYKPRPLLRCPITAFGGLLDARTPQSHLRAWREQTVGDFNMHLLPGDHFFIRTSQRALLEVLMGHVFEMLCSASESSLPIGGI